MTHTFTAHYAIRQYELNSREELPNSALARLFQETAMRGSADAGFGIEWYTKQNSVWVIHQHTIEHFKPIGYGDELNITTWVSDFRRVFSHREYLARNQRDELVACGRANWLHLNPKTMMPARLDPKVVEVFAPNGERAVQRTEPRDYLLRVAQVEFSTTRRVQRYEADGMQHVNNAVYVDWLEETLAEAIATRVAPSDARLYVRRHDIEYLRGALAGDEIKIAARLIGAGHSASAWSLEVTRGNETLVRNRLTAFWRDACGRAVKFSW